MSQEQEHLLFSPFDCAVCGACVYGNNSGIRICLPCKSFFKRHAFLPPNSLKCNQNGKCYIEMTRRYFSADLPPCRACRLQKCLSVGMDQYLLRSRSSSSPPLISMNQFYNNTMIKTSSCDDNTVTSNKQMSDIGRKMNNDEVMDERIRCLSDASDCRRRF